jgi:hypothetical protein
MCKVKEERRCTLLINLLVLNIVLIAADGAQDARKHS